MSSRRNLWLETLEAFSDDDLSRLNIARPLDQHALSPILTSVIADIQHQHSLCDKNAFKFVFRSRQIILRDVADKIIRWVQSFRTIGDIVVQYDPGHAALPWAAVRFLLQAMVADAEQRGLLLVSIEVITKSVLHCGLYEDICGRLVAASDAATDHQISNFVDSFLQSIKSHYRSIVETLLLLARILSANRAKRLLGAVAHPDQVPSLVDKLEKEVFKLQTHHQQASSLESRASFENLHNKLEELRNPIRQAANLQHSTFQVLEELTFLSILDWCSDIKYSSHHDAVREKRAKNTGHWIQKHHAVRQWQESSSSSLLLLLGGPGAGKTCLVSSFIDWSESRIQATHGVSQVLSAESETFAFFYCNREQEARRYAINVFRAFVKQTVAATSASHAVHSDLKETWAVFRAQSRDLDMPACRRILLAAIASRPLTTLYLDALDECEELERAKILSEFRLLANDAASPLKVLISSRPNPDIREGFDEQEQLQIMVADTSEDVSTFIDQEMAKGRWQKIEPAVKEHVKRTLIEKSQGMFLWVELQLRQLSRLKLWNSSILQERVQLMPEGLKAMYDEMYKAILELPLHEKNLAIRALAWVYSSDRDLSRSWLLEAVRIDPDTEEPNEPLEGLDETTILSLCGTFLAYDKLNDYFHFNHLSAWEYLDSDPQKSSVARLMVAESTMKQLVAQPDCRFHFDTCGLAYNTSIRDCFCQWLRDDWPNALVPPERDTEPSLCLQPRLKLFFGLTDWQDDEVPFYTWCESHDGRLGRGYSKIKFLKQGISKKYCRRGKDSFVFGVCVFGYQSLLQWCLEDSRRQTYWPVVQSYESLPLALALTSGYEAIALTFLRNGFTVDRNASLELSFAAEQSAFGVAEYVLSSGVHPDHVAMRPVILHPVLNYVREHEDLVHAPLLDAITIDNMESSLKMVTLLLTAGADINLTLEEGTEHGYQYYFRFETIKINALSMALVLNRKPIVAFLLQRGAALPSKDIAYVKKLGHILTTKTAGLGLELFLGFLEQPISQQVLDMCLLEALLSWEHPWPPWWVHTRRWTPDQKVLREAELNIDDDNPYPGIVRKMLEFGANINLKLPKPLGSLLGAVAASEGYEHSLAHLLKLGLDPNDIGHEMVMPLSLLRHSIKDRFPDLRVPCEPKTNILLAAGAKVNMVSSSPYAPTALCSALMGSTCSCKCFDVLLRNGADPNLFSRGCNTPLQLAINMNRRVAVEPLLRAGADPNLYPSCVDFYYPRPHVDFYYPRPRVEWEDAEQQETLEELIRTWYSRFCRIDGSPLELAVAKKKPRLISCLLSYGADVNLLSNTSHGSPLGAAMSLSYMSSLRTSKLLVKKGADLNLNPGHGPWTVLALAAASGHLLTCDFLLKSGSNPFVPLTGWYRNALWFVLATIDKRLHREALPQTLYVSGATVAVGPRCQADYGIYRALPPILRYPTEEEGEEEEKEEEEEDDDAWPESSSQSSVASSSKSSAGRSMSSARLAEESSLSKAIGEFIRGSCCPWSVHAGDIFLYARHLAIIEMLLQAGVPVPMPLYADVSGGLPPICPSGSSTNLCWNVIAATMLLQETDGTWHSLLLSQGWTVWYLASVREEWLAAEVGRWGIALPLIGKALFVVRLSSVSHPTDRWHGIVRWKDGVSTRYVVREGHTRESQQQVKRRRKRSVKSSTPSRQGEALRQKASMGGSTAVIVALAVVSSILALLALYGWVRYRHELSGLRTNHLA